MLILLGLSSPSTPTFGEVKDDISFIYQEMTNLSPIALVALVTVTHARSEPIYRCIGKAPE